MYDESMDRTSDESQPAKPPELQYQGPGDDEGVNRRLDRLEGCFIWGLGVPVVGVIMAGLLAVVWGWGTTGRAEEWVKWIASAIIVIGIGAMLWAVLRVKRNR